METGNLKKLTLDDIVFAGRNKLYGAYLLRRIYNKHITVASIVASTLFLLLISMPLLARLLETEDSVKFPAKKETIVDVIILPPPTTEPVLPPPPPQPQIKENTPPPTQAVVKFTPPVVTRDQDVLQEADIPEVDALKDVNIGLKTVEGEKGALPAIGVEGGTGTAEVTDEVISDKPYTIAEQMPSFPGGEKAMFEFIGKNIKYPRQAINVGIEGKVFVSFVVDRNGEISDIQVLRGLGAGCDEESIRVIKNMPKWTPGKQNGRTVPVRYNLPIKFTLR